MKRYYMYILWIFVCFLLTACSDSADVADDRIESPSLILQETEQLIIEANGGLVYIHLKALTDWKIKSEQSWCVLEQTEGDAGTWTIAVLVKENLGYDERNNVLKIESKEGEVQTVMVVQKQKNAILLSSDKVEMPADGGVFEIVVESNVDFTYNISNDAKEWIVPVITGRTLTKSTLKFECGNNTSNVQRQGCIVVTKGDLKETVVVYQEAFNPSLVLSQKDYVVGSAGDTLKIELKSNIDYQMIIPKLDWLSVVESRSKSSFTHYISVLPNLEYDSRVAEVLFINEERQLTDTVRITQVQLDALIVSKEIYSLSADSCELNMTINTNVDFDIDVSEEWITPIVESRSLLTINTKFKVEANVGNNQREAWIILSYGDISQKIKILQYGRLQNGKVNIVISGSSFSAPLFMGDDVFGIVYWGDESENDYQQGISHSYDDINEYIIKFDIWGSEQLLIPNIVGIKSLDFREW